MTRPLALAAFGLALPASLALAGCNQATPPLAGAWTLDPAHSSVAFVSTKAGTIAEAHGFGKLSGGVSKAGAATVTIDLASVDTGIDIRNQRMRDILFETAKFPAATVSAQLDPATFDKLAVGDSLTQTVPLTIDLHGTRATAEAKLTVTRSAPGRVLVTTTRPVIVTADQFGLTGELEQLQALAKLPAISPAVPVTATLTFAQ